MSDTTQLNAESQVKTPDFTHLQGYLGGANGLNIKNAWTRGFEGENSCIHVYEAMDACSDHEDLKGQDISYLSPKPPPKRQSDLDHGTAVLGIMAARKNDFGITGIAYKAKYHYYSGDFFSAAKDIIKNTKAGDIFTTSAGAFIWLNGKTITLGINYDFFIKDFLKTLSAKGVVNLFALGNSHIDLAKAGPFSESSDFSYGIAVGACESTDTSKRLIVHQDDETAGSNYNAPTRTLNAWGNEVATLGGTDKNINEGHDAYEKYYTAKFRGTSAATPQVAGALALIQSHALKKHHIYLNFRDLYALVTTTGYREAVNQGIGTRPNVLAAINRLDQILVPVVPQSSNEPPTSEDKTEL